MDNTDRAETRQPERTAAENAAARLREIDTVEALNHSARRRSNTDGQPDHAGLAAADLMVDTAKLGAMLAGKGLTPDQVAAVMRHQILPVLDEALRCVEQGAAPDSIRFEVREAAAVR